MLEDEWCSVLHLHFTPKSDITLEDIRDIFKFPHLLNEQHLPPHLASSARHQGEDP